MKKIIALSIVLFFVSTALCGNNGLALKSAVVPGMGQISAGDGNVRSFNTLKGLGIMAGFTFCLHGMLSSISERESYVEQTQFYADELEKNRISGTFSQQTALETARKDAFDNYESANTWTLVYLGLTAAFYGYGIVDALLFTKEDEKKEGTSGLTPKNLHLAVGPVGQGSGLKVNYRF